MRVIGTAGHVDHGKSTLVKALSGIDPDRLREEKERGLTIDLGFAWIELPLPTDAGDAGAETVGVGIVDVPGHIDFIKNMLAGIGSIDAAVLVIAADEGVMPQTREHLAILDLLAVPAGVVALTKVDLIDEPEWLDLVELDVLELTQGTALADAPVVRVSAATGQGLAELQRTLGAALAGLAPRRNRARPRLPIDRVFSLSGFGTVVTGTLSDGPFAVGDEVEILPGEHTARIRGLQTHKKPIWQGEPGSRLSINLNGVGVEELERGQVVVKPGTLRSTRLIDVSFRLLPDAVRSVEHNQLVHFFCGAAEVTAHVRLLGTELLEPGQQGWLQLRLDAPVVVAEGDRYILRQPSPSATLGGGRVLHPHPRRRWKRFDEAVIERLQTLARGAPDEILLHTLSRSLFLAPTELLSQSGLDLEIASAALSELQAAGAMAIVPVGEETVLLSHEAWSALMETVRAVLAEFHAQFPLRRGMGRGELHSRLQRRFAAQLAGGTWSVRVFNACIEQLVAHETLDADEGAVWLPDFTVTLTLHQQSMIDALLDAFSAAPYAPPSEQECLRHLDQDEALLEYLLETDQLVRVGDGVLFRSQDFAEMQRAVEQFIQDNGSVTLAQARDLFQTSRKYAQALLEALDAQRVTVRRGDVRVLRAGR